MKTFDSRLLTGAFLGGMLLLYLGERVLFDNTAVRVVFALLMAASLVFAVAGRVGRIAQLGSVARPVEKRILWCYFGAIAALLLYLMQSDIAMDRLRPILQSSKTIERYEVIFAALWPIVWACSVIPLLFIELSYAPMDPKTTVELPRIRRSMYSAMVLVMTVATIFSLNFIVSDYNKKWDLSYFKTTKPSESSRKMVANLSAPLKVLLFFPGANEVQDKVESYFNDLKSASAHLTVSVIDHDLEPKLAKEYSVSNNGTIVLVKGKQHQEIALDTDLKRAKSKLKKLDNEFQTAFYKVGTPAKVAYLTTGHEERTQDLRDGVVGSSIKDLRTVLEKLNYEIKNLGIAEGLASEIPKDATVVLILGPRKAFLPAEIASLKNYLRGGGRVLAFFDPEAGIDFSELLNPFGLKYSPVAVANNRYFARLTYTPADQLNVFSNSYSGHPSVSTLTQNSSKLATVFTGVGSFEEMPPTEGGKPQALSIVHSMPFTFADANNNYQMDAPAEQHKTFELAGAISMAVNSPLAPDKNKKAGETGPELRAVFVGDSDVVSDKLLGNPGNLYLLLDAIKWLGGEEKFIGETTSEEDVPIAHTRKQDQVWFYLTIFGVPALVVVSGIAVTRRRRKRS